MTRIYAFIAFCIVFGPIATVWGLVEAIKGARTRKWPSTHGVIKAAWVEPGYRDRWGTQFYNAVIFYTFSVAGTSREGNQVSIGGGEGQGLSADDARRRVQRYPTGTAVEVYYDPHDPAQTVLEPSIRMQPVGAMILGMFLLGFAAFFFLRGF